MPAGAALAATGAAVVDGAFTNQGTVGGPGGEDSLTFIDDVHGDGSYTGNITFSDGFSPGNSAAVVSFENVIFDGTAELAIELGGVDNGDPQNAQFDQIIADDASLSGALEVTYLDGFTASPGDTFLIIEAHTLAGTFDTVNFPDAQDWFADYDTLAGTLTVGVTLCSIDGDHDGDCAVTLKDLAIVQTGLGTEVPAAVEYTLRDVGPDGIADSSSPPEEFFFGFITNATIFTDETFLDFPVSGGTVASVTLMFTLRNRSSGNESFDISTRVGTGEIDLGAIGTGNVLSTEIHTVDFGFETFSIDVTAAYNNAAIAGDSFLGLRLHNVQGGIEQLFYQEGSGKLTLADFDRSDIVELVRHLGRVGPAASQAAVPEPSSLVLALMALSLLLICRRGISPANV